MTRADPAAFTPADVTVDTPTTRVATPQREILPGWMLPHGTQCVELHAPRPTLENFHSLYPAEQELVAGAVDRRKADFGDSRWCAHQAMRPFTRAAGYPANPPIGRGARGMPVFPEGLTGSLTHTQGYRAAIVGRQDAYRSLGIDAEVAEPLPDRVFASIALPAERRRIRRLSQRTGLHHLDTVLFSAKEATYKAWFPLTHRFLDFHQADIDIRPDGTFVSHLLTSPVPVPFIQGRWTVRGGFVVTVAAVEARG